MISKASFEFLKFVNFSQQLLKHNFLVFFSISSSDNFNKISLDSKLSFF